MAGESDAGLESPEVDAPAILAFTFGFMAFVAISLGLLGVYYHHTEVGVAPRQLRKFPAPRLETHSGETLEALRKSWVERASEPTTADREHGPVRIPIARAIEIVAARASKAYDPPDAPSNPASAAP
jgi:hypothetical protein